MGNHLACISIPNSAKQSKLILLVHSGESRLLEISGPTMQVAELMLEFPGYFITELVYSSSISTTRAVPMAAHQELLSFGTKKPGLAYVLVPMSRLQKPVPAQEWTSWTQMVIKHLSAAPLKKQRSRGRVSNRVAPDIDIVEDSAFQTTEATIDDDQVEEQETTQQITEQLASICISTYSRRTYWAPKLETIIEV